MVREQNNFSRTMSNDMKMGFYPTDNDHCSSLGETLVFSEEETTCCLEPCCGEGAAAMALTRPDKNEQIRWFLAELSQERANIAKNNPAFEEVVCDDFIEGMRMSKNAFSFCFCNPPYQDDNLTEDGQSERLEKQFLMKLTDYLTKGALLVWVVPFKSFVDISQFRYMAQRYEILKVWKFRPDEYAKFHQVAVIARKKDPKILLKEELDAIRAKYPDVDSLEELPLHPTERFEVFPSDADKVQLFTSRVFDERAACQKIREMQSSADFDDLNRLLNRRITTPKFSFGKAGRPPIPPKKDTLYLMATSGYGAGLTGSLENGDLHLQRGVAEVVEDQVYEADPSDPDKDVLRVTSRTQVTMTVVQNDGTITVLE